jgi:hypothetical protein
VRAEAGCAEVADVVAGRTDGTSQVGIAAAVRAEAGRIDVAEAVLARAGLAERAVPVAAAVRHGLGRIEIADDVLAQTGLADASAPVAAAVRAEAGMIDAVPAVVQVVSPGWVGALLDRQLDPDAHRLAVRQLMSDPAAAGEMTALADVGRHVRTAVTDAAGEVETLWPAVARALGVDADDVVGWDGRHVADAVRDEAGSVDVVATVMRRVRQSATVPADGGFPIPVNKNNWGAVALAAAALLAVFGGRAWFDAPIGEREPVGLQFATAAEVSVDDLSYGENAMVQLIEGEGDDETVVLWVEEEIL